MVEMSNLNRGWLVLNMPKPKFEEKEYTVVVSGLGRSGTSMVGKLLTVGGLPMGVNGADVIHEDIGLSNAIETANVEVICRVAESRNERFKRWGFKRPLVIKHDAIIEKYLRNPRYVLIFRDPLAVAMRNSLSLGMAVPNGLGLFNQQFMEIVTFMQRNTSPKFLVSYEKALQDPQGFVVALARFCGINPQKTASMQQFIKPNDESYRERTMAKDSPGSEAKNSSEAEVEQQNYG
jgi:hypothetical protein